MDVRALRQSHFLYSCFGVFVMSAADVRAPAARDVTDDVTSTVDDCTETGAVTTVIHGRHFKE